MKNVRIGKSPAMIQLSASERVVLARAMRLLAEHERRKGDRARLLRQVTIIEGKPER